GGSPGVAGDAGSRRLHVAVAEGRTTKPHPGADDHRDRLDSAADAGRALWGAGPRRRVRSARRPAVGAQFLLAEERLAWPIRPGHGEVASLETLPTPHPTLIATLEAHGDDRGLLASPTDARPESLR